MTSAAASPRGKRRRKRACVTGARAALAWTSRWVGKARRASSARQRRVQLGGLWCAGRGSQSTCAPARRANWLREELQANRADEVGVWRIEQQLLRVVTSLRQLSTSAGGRWRRGRAGHRWSDRPVPARLIGVDVPEVGVSGGSVLRLGPFGRQDAHGRPPPVELVPLRLLAVCGIRQALLWARVIRGGNGTLSIRKPRYALPPRSTGLVARS